MFTYSALVLLPFITGGFTPNNSFYDFGAKLTQSQTVQGAILQSFDGSETFYTIDTIYFTAYMSYDLGSYGTEGSWYLSDFTFTIRSSLYRIIPSDDEGIYVHSLTCTYSPSPQWEYTQNTSFNELDNLEYFVHLDGRNAEYEIGIKVDGGAYESSYYTFDFDSNYDSYAITNVNTTYLSNYLSEYATRGLSSVDLDSIEQEAHDEGFAEGVEYASHNGEAAVVFSGILSVALLPVNFFLQILNFEVFGINIGGFVTGLLTLAIIFIIWRVILGGRTPTK